VRVKLVEKIRWLMRFAKWRNKDFIGRILMTIESRCIWVVMITQKVPGLGERNPRFDRRGYIEVGKKI
jgi:hypothetical protein